MTIYCCECKKDVNARLTDGKEVYPHRRDLYYLPFWICDDCKNYVGTHHKTSDRTRPLGVIPNKEIRDLRKKIHTILDPLWKNVGENRKYFYEKISDYLGYEYHTANIRSIKEGNDILYYLTQITEGK